MEKQITEKKSVKDKLDAELNVAEDIIADFECPDVGSIDLIAVEEIKGMGIFGKAWSNIKLLVYRFLMEED